jgi:predicted enzyme related to lactoylglutathione lyase
MPTRREALSFLAAAVPACAEPQAARTPNPVVHFEIGCEDRAKTGRFYADLFGWKVQASGPASNIDTGSPQGIQGHITSLGHEPRHYTMFYVEVEDVQASLDKAVTLGGTVLVKPVKIPTGTFAWFADPDGNTIGLIKSNR